MNENKLVAHRGDNTNFPENSYAGFESALKAGALYIEFDIQMNVDGSLLIFHDINFKRVGNEDDAENERNNDISIFDTTEERLKTLSMHEPDRFAEKHFPTEVPHLSDILKLLNLYPNAHAFVEVKRESLVRWGMSKVVDKILHALKGFESQATIISFSSSAIKHVQQNSSFPTGLVFYQYKDGIRDIATILQPDYLICAYTIFPEKEALWEGDWKWMVYSVNDITIIRDIINNRDEISLIETDNISLMLVQ